MRRLLTACPLLVAAIGLAGCVGLADWSSEADLSAPGRGKVYAEMQCAQCHEVGRGSQSPDPGAPTFSSIRMRSTGPSLHREFEAISELGHYRMPPKSIAPADRRDLIEYIESLGL